MTDKRFTIEPSLLVDGKYVIMDKDRYFDKTSYVFPPLPFNLNLMFLKALNDLNDENEQLKKELEDALLDVKIYKNANTTFDNVYQENEKLKSRIEYLERKIERERNATNKQYEKWEKEALEKINKLEKENEQLKNEIVKFKEWEKHIGDVKREDLDRVFKMSVYEIAEAFNYYEKRIKELEE